MSRADQGRNAIPLSRARTQGTLAQLRTQDVQKDGKDFIVVEGYASIVERGYAMWDAFGEYTEVVSASAFDETLRANPDVAFLENHGGRAMARTGAKTLELTADETGLFCRAYLNPTRSDVQDLVQAIRDGSVREMSFAFVIDEGTWSPDYSEYRIERVNLDRGDVSAVTYGANPHTSIEARGASLLNAIDDMPEAHARAAYARLAARFVDDTDTTTGSTVAFRRAQLALDDN